MNCCLESSGCSRLSWWMQKLVLSRVALDIISGPGRNLAKFSYSAPAGYGRRIWGRIWLSFDASASLCNWAGIHCFTNSVICTSLFHNGHVYHTHILVSVCVSLLVTCHVMWSSLGLQLKNIRPRLDLQSQIWPRPNLKKIKSCSTLVLRPSVAGTLTLKPTVFQNTSFIVPLPSPHHPHSHTPRP